MSTISPSPSAFSLSCVARSARSATAFRAVGLFLTLLSLGGTSAFAGFPLFGHNDFDVVTNGDVTPEGQGVLRPSKDNTLPYIAVSMGYREMGKSVAGEKAPRQGQVVDVITKVLQKQGYVLATTASAPKILIVYTWGTLNASKMVYDTTMPEITMNSRQILGFLGYDKETGVSELFARGPREFGPDLTFLQRDRNRSLLQEMGTQNYYIIALAAYDYTAASQGKSVLLWRTRISSPSQGFAMSESLPKMMAIAGPQIGRDTGAPVWIHAGDHYRPDVEIGPATEVKD